MARRHTKGGPSVSMLPSKAPCSTVVDIFPHSDGLYSDHAFRYCLSVALHRDCHDTKETAVSSSSSSLWLEQRVRVGELVAVECHDPTDTDALDMAQSFSLGGRPRHTVWPGRPWRVGQVLALRLSLRTTATATTTTTTTTAADNHTNNHTNNLHQHEAIVRWLPPWEYMLPRLDEAQRKRLTKEIRPHSMLWQCDVQPHGSNPNHHHHHHHHHTVSANHPTDPFVQTIPLTHVLPMDVRLKPSVDFTQSQTATVVVPGQAWGYAYHCERRFVSRVQPDGTTTVVVQACDRTDLCADSQRYNNNRSVPPGLDRSWDRHLEPPALVAALRKAYVATANAAAQGRTDHDDSDVRICILPDEDAMEEEDMDDKDEDSNEPSVSAAVPRRAPLRPRQPSRPATAKHKKSSTHTTKKNKPKSKPTATKRKPNVAAASQRSKKRPRVETVSSAATPSTVESSSVDDSIAPTHRLGKVVYRDRPKGTSTSTSNSATTKATTIERHFAKDVWIRHPDDSDDDAIRLAVGDLVAIAVDDATAKAPIHTSRRSKAHSPWYPFEQPWCPAQIVAIYQTSTTRTTRTSSKHKNKHPPATSAPVTETSPVMLQIRWFYRPHDLPDEVVEHLSPEHSRDLFHRPVHKLLSGRTVVEVDEDSFDTSCDTVVGRVRLTSRVDPDNDAYLRSLESHDGLPQLPLVCRHMHCMREFTGVEGLTLLPAAADWTDYKNDSTGGALTSSAAYQRGIQCPKSWPGRIRRLGRAYGRNLDKAQRCTTLTPAELDGDDASRRNNDATDENVARVCSVWPDELLSATASHHASAESSPPSIICQGQQQGQASALEYLHSLSVAVVSRRCDARATAKKTQTHPTWTMAIGDVVCVAYNGANPRGTASQPHATTNNNNKKNPWFPFAGPWRFGQVLSMYREASQNNGHDTRMEVRWLLRRSDLPRHVIPWMPDVTPGATKEEEVYESNVVEAGIPVAHVLGGGTLFLGHQTEAWNSRRRGHAPPMSLGPSCRCRYSYNSVVERFQPIFCAELSPKLWFDRFLVRGFNTSLLIRNDEYLSQCIEMHMNVTLGSNVIGKGNIFHSMLKEPQVKAEEHHVPLDNSGVHASNLEYFISVNVPPPWTKFQHLDVVCGEKDRRGQYWKVRVGDVVAILDSSRKAVSTENYPYTVAWRPAQVLAIYNDNHTHTNARDNMQFQIRWFYRCRDHSVLHESVFREGLELVYSTDDLSCAPVCQTDLLGPISLFRGDQNSMQRCKYVWDSMPSYLPANPLLYGGHFETKREQKVFAPQLAALIDNGVRLSSHYSDIARQRLLDILQSDAEALYEEEGIQSLLPMLTSSAQTSDARPTALSSPLAKNAPDQGTKYTTSVPPFHTDHSMKLSYYSQLDVEPPYDSYLTEAPNENSKVKCVWTLRLGDAVALHYRKCMGPAAYQFKPGSRMKYHSSRSNSPFSVPWAIGEIVSIFERAPIDRKQDFTGNERENIRLEIRWFYRADELPGSTVSQNHDGSTCEEIYESDLYDEVAPSSLLAPVILYGQKRAFTVGKSFLSMPVIEFQCRHFYSAHRKSVIAVGGLNRRKERGRAGSKFIANNMALEESFHRFSSGSVLAEQVLPRTQKEIPWTDAFSSVIDKLSLTNASKEAYDHETALVGREKELKQISSFLRSVVCGRAQDKANSSLFVAGPPGTGKTASIRAAICQLKREQASGIVPSFNFIPLNGMEMRHPFEAYVKLWEALSVENSTCSAGTAESKLESFFLGKDQHDENDACRVTIVLLDEIDYLVTKKQTVLYNFFDWPMRSLLSRSKRRLIVIGVSNTLNLPERMHPKVRSRIGSNRIFFKAYNGDETVNILTSKIDSASPGYSVFQADAILFASKTTAARSGDIRKAFHICRSAAETVLNDSNVSNDGKGRQVRIEDVVKISKDSLNSAQSRSVASAAPFQVLLIVGLASLSISTGRESGGFDVEELVSKMEVMADALGDQMYLPPPTLHETLFMLTRLSETHLVALSTPRDTSMSYRASLVGSGGAWPLVTSTVEESAVGRALKDTCHQKLAQRYLKLSSRPFC